MGMFRTPAKPPRKDFNREKVIIHENADDSIKTHLVRFMFSNFVLYILLTVEVIYISKNKWETHSAE